MFNSSKNLVTALLQILVLYQLFYSRNILFDFGRNFGRANIKKPARSAVISYISLEIARWETEITESVAANKVYIVNWQIIRELTLHS